MGKSDNMAVAKARILGADAPPPNAMLVDDEQTTFTAAGALDPPYNPRDLIAIYERSASLQPNVTAYAVNIECFGHRLEPTLDLDAADATDRIRDAIILERRFDGEIPDVSEEAVEAKRFEIESTMRIEKLETEIFFQNCCQGMSFVELRERKRIDQESTGNAYWEIIRDDAGKVAQLSYVPSISTRLLRAEPEWTEVEMPQKISAIASRRVKVKRRFRRYVQLFNGQEKIFFKEFGDPRIISSASGKSYHSQAEMHGAEPKARLATEIIHFAIHWPTSAYGVPRWIGVTPEVLGSRAAAEVNLAYFDNKAIPPMAILVSGGTLGQDSVDRIESYINEKIVGRANFHSIIVIEAESAESADGSARNNVKIEMKPLMDAQLKDALFLEYDKSNAEKIGNSFRLPKILRGDSADVNRSTAKEAIDYAEQQVFQPEREKDDHKINRLLFSELGVRFWKFVSNGPSTKDPTELVEMVTKTVVANILTPGEGRELLGKDAFHKEMKQIDQPWVDQPVAMLTNGQAPPMGDNPGVGDVGGTGKSAQSMEEIAHSLGGVKLQLQRTLADRASANADAGRGEDAAQVVRVKPEEMGYLLGGPKPAPGPA